MLADRSRPYLTTLTPFSKFPATRERLEPATKYPTGPSCNRVSAAAALSCNGRSGVRHVRSSATIRAPARPTPAPTPAALGHAGSVSGVVSMVQPLRLSTHNPPPHTPAIALGGPIEGAKSRDAGSHDLEASPRSFLRSSLGGRAAVHGVSTAYAGAGGFCEGRGTRVAGTSLRQALSSRRRHSRSSTPWLRQPSRPAGMTPVTRAAGHRSLSRRSRHRLGALAAGSVPVGPRTVRRRRKCSRRLAYDSTAGPSYAVDRSYG